MEDHEAREGLKGVSTDGAVSYRTYTTGSDGAPDTSERNTVISVALLLNFLKHDEKLLQNSAIMVLGDDVYAMIPFKESPDELCALLTDHYTRAGFCPKVKCTPYLADHPYIIPIEFCSQIAYPAIDQGIECYAFSVLIGKFLTRIGFTQSEPTVGRHTALKSICLGLEASVQHVPLVRDYVNRVLELTKGIAAAPETDPHKTYLSKPLSVSPRVYTFLQDRYNVSYDEVEQAATILRGMELDDVIHDFPILAKFRSVEGG